MSLNGSESGGRHLPARFFAPSGPAIPELIVAGKKKGRTSATRENPRVDADYGWRCFSGVKCGRVRATTFPIRQHAYSHEKSAQRSKQTSPSIAKRSPRASLLWCSDVARS